MNKVPKRCVLFVAAALALASCAEAEDPAYVWGTVTANVIDPTTSTLSGTLAKSGERYFGFCDYDAKEETFSFGVGSGKPGLSNSSDWYLVLEGVKGPPQEGTFGAGGDPKSGDAYRTTFGRAVVTQLYSWVVLGAEVDSDHCNVRLFSKAGVGEVEPKSERRFQYYVEVGCRGVDIPDQNKTGINLSTFEASLYFKGCD